MALIGNMINNSWHGAAGTVNYSLFPPAFAMAVLIFAIPVACRPSLVIHPAILFILDFLVMLCTFAAAVALPSKLHAKSCSNHVGSFFLSFYSLRRLRRLHAREILDYRIPNRSVSRATHQLTK